MEIFIFLAVLGVSIFVFILYGKVFDQIPDPDKINKKKSEENDGLK